jgi:tripartite-type tricarboxylate transporter receptor subunit TctC
MFRADRAEYARRLAAAFLVAACFGSAYGQTKGGGDYPTRRITIYAVGPGGITDIAARQVAQGISLELGQPVIVDNRSSLVSVQMASKAPPDGYSLLYTAGSLWINQLTSDVPYDIQRDFIPISLVHDAPQMLAVHPSLPVRNVKEFIALAKARPGDLNYGGSPSMGAGSNLAAEQLAYMANINIVRIPYKSGGERMTSLLSGEVHFAFITGVLFTQLPKGKVRFLGVTTQKPLPLAPDIPPISNTIPGYENRQVGGLFVTRGTPAAIVNRLSQSVIRALKRPEISDRIVKSGVEVEGTTSEEFASFIKREMESMDKVIKARGLRQPQ